MGGSYYNKDDYAARTKTRATYSSTAGISMADATFKHSYDIKIGMTDAVVHATLDPYGVKVRESRDSSAHPVTVPIAVLFDSTGSMQEVPQIMQRELTKLMGHFLNDKASGKKYLGEGYPAIMVGAFDDFNAMGGSKGDGTLQVGQFESGIEIDDNLTNIWLTGRGGGTYDEESELALYFMAKHTAHDHMEKRNRKGYIFLITDEHAYRHLDPHKVSTILGEKIQGPIPIKTLVEEAQKLYNVFTIIPALTSHYDDRELERWWVNLLGQQNVIKLEDPEKICELIAATVAICEEHTDLEDLETDGLLEGLTGALVSLSKTKEVSKYSAEGLPDVPGKAGGVERI